MKGGRHIARRIAIIATGLALAASVVGTANAAQPAPTTPELFDLDLAQSRVDAINDAITQLQNQLAVTLEEVDALTDARDYIDLNKKERNDLMQQARTNARTMAINAYVGIGPPLSGVVVLDAESANDLSYRRGLLRQQAERMQDNANTYQILAGEADANLLAMSDTINDEVRKAEALNRRISQEQAKLPDAEWHVSIAMIHNEADQEFNSRGRVEPTAEQWRKLRHCESTETYDVDSGNTFYGAYQFTWDTWETVGGSATPLTRRQPNKTLGLGCSIRGAAHNPGQSAGDSYRSKRTASNAMVFGAMSAMLSR